MELRRLAPVIGLIGACVAAQDLEVVSPADGFLAIASQDPGVDAVWFSSDCAVWAWGDFLEVFMDAVEEERARRLRAWLDGIVRALREADATDARDDLLLFHAVALALLDGESPAACDPRLDAEIRRSYAAYVRDRSLPERSLGHVSGVDDAASFGVGGAAYTARGREGLYRAVTWLRQACVGGMRPECTRVLNALCRGDEALRAARSRYLALLEVHFAIWGAAAQVCWDCGVEDRCVLEPFAVPPDLAFLDGVDGDVADPATTLLSVVAAGAGHRADVAPAPRQLFLEALAELLESRDSALFAAQEAGWWPRHRREVAAYAYVWVRELDALAVSLPLARGLDDLEVVVEPARAFYRRVAASFEMLARIAESAPIRDGESFARLATGRCDLMRAAIRVLDAQEGRGEFDADAVAAIRRACETGLRRRSLAESLGLPDEDRAGAVLRTPFGEFRRGALRARPITLRHAGRDLRAAAVLAAVEVRGPGAEEFSLPEWSALLR